MCRFRKTTLLAVMIFVSILSSCIATVPPASREYELMAGGFAPPPGMASVYIYRPYATVGSAILTSVKIDYQMLGTIAPNTYLFRNIRPGTHAIRVADKKISGITKFDAKAGEIYFFKAQYVSGVFDIQINIEQVDGRAGREKIIGFKLSGDNPVDRASTMQSMTGNHVLIAYKNNAYTVFASIPKDKIDTIKKKPQTAEKQEIVDWAEFTNNLEKYMKARIMKNEYPASRVTEGILELLKKYHQTPFGLTWNGGVAITANDYQHSERTYKQYQDNPAEYEHIKIKDARLDPVNPENHLGPLLESQ